MFDDTCLDGGLIIARECLEDVRRRVDVRTRLVIDCDDMAP